jgi:hypothetical protein
MVTGVGFKPRAIILLACANHSGPISGLASYGICIPPIGGFGGGGGQNYCIYDSNDSSASTYGISNTDSIRVYWGNAAVGATGVVLGNVSAVSNDGFTITWNPSSSSAVTVKALCFR